MGRGVLTLQSRLRREVATASRVVQRVLCSIPCVLPSVGVALSMVASWRYAITGLARRVGMHWSALPSFTMKIGRGVSAMVWLGRRLYCPLAVNGSRAMGGRAFPRGILGRTVTIRSLFRTCLLVSALFFFLLEHLFVQLVTVFRNCQLDVVIQRNADHAIT